jgi:E3 ubiquitin-protein ligase listerin
MLEQAKATLSDAAAEDKSVLAQLLFPARNLWEDKLRPFLDVTPNTAMAVTNALGGAINSVVGSSEAASEIYKISFDSDSFSPALRVVLFALRLIADLDVLSLVSADQRESTFIYFPMAIQLIDDNLTIAGANHMWNMYVDEIENEMADVVSEGRQVMARWIRESSHTPSADSAWVGKEFLAVWEAQLDNIQGCAPSMFHLGRSYARILSESADSAGTCIYASSWKDWIWKIRAVPDTIYGAAFSSAFKALLMSVGEGRRLINELMADLTGLDLDTSRDEAFRKLVLFNILSEGEESPLEDVPKQRLVFLVKHLVEWLQGRDAHVSLAIQAESLKSLTHVLPFISDVYGSHWQDILIVLEATVNDPASDQSLQWTHACLKMIATLKSLSKDDSNDDLTDSWEAWSETGLPRTLVNMLHSFHQDKYRVNQPRSIVTDALARQIGLTGVKSDEKSVHSTYGLLREESSGVQKAAFTVISRYLPAAQENLSVRVGASGEAARLPDELLSLLLETPNTDALLRAHSEQRMWLNIRGYLLGWKVLFDHFETAVSRVRGESVYFTNAFQSHKVKNDYIDSIKEGDYLPSLLAFTFDFLGHATGKSIDASKFPIVSYALDAQETSEKDIQSLVIHLYFLCLVHVPIITKTWWIDSQKRVKGPIETWTQKFISSHVIASAFKTVSTWELESLADSDQSKLEIKISPKASELTASIAVGEGGDSPPISIAISLPPAYPLQPATVVGRQRVVVDEKKWRSWLLTIQGVIMFHGNLADGLIAFRKNVQGALKGQSECAICYSVISSDMQTPNKRCGTCKNMFHSSCLFRWFRSSNSSSCPLCRNSFNYG